MLTDGNSIRTDSARLIAFCPGSTERKAMRFQLILQQLHSDVPLGETLRHQESKHHVRLCALVYADFVVVSVIKVSSSLEL